LTAAFERDAGSFGGATGDSGATGCSKTAELAKVGPLLSFLFSLCQRTVTGEDRHIYK
jgi:hypothetical protein